MGGVQGAKGSVDLLPPAAARRRALVDALLGTFGTWGYRQVVTPTVERYEVLAAGLSAAARAHVVRFVSGPGSQVVALRSDVTPQIARMVAHHRGTTWPADAVLRLSYTADVVRQPSDAREKTEQHQVGVEFVGDGTVAADAELVALAHAALGRAGLTGFRFDLSHAGIAHGALDALGLDAGDRKGVEALLARKDRDGLEARLTTLGVDPAVAQRVASLCDAYGRPDVIDRVRDVPGVSGLETLEAITAYLRAVHPDAADVLDVDLGEVRGFDYYTGVRLRVWCPGVATPVLRGGRYDDLIGRFGEGTPATGFAIDLDALERALGDRGPRGHGRSGRLVALHPDCDDEARLEAARRAAAARGTGEPAWVQQDLTLEQAQIVAADAGAGALTFLQPDASGRMAVLRLRQTQDGCWART
ncbi:MAG: ATP phosphoribosyltransferase regulatory subunit [Nannocystaceae bacterium]|nr:ATP phosphoribosyltransferase regulatory subunit [bacterium]